MSLCCPVLGAHWEHCWILKVKGWFASTDCHVGLQCEFPGSKPSWCLSNGCKSPGLLLFRFTSLGQNRVFVDDINSNFPWAFRLLRYTGAGKQIMFLGHKMMEKSNSQFIDFFHSHLLCPSLGGHLFFEVYEVFRSLQMSCFIDMSIPYYEDNSILGRCNGFAKGSTKDKANRHSALITVISLHLALVDGNTALSSHKLRRQWLIISLGAGYQNVSHIVWDLPVFAHILTGSDLHADVASADLGCRSWLKWLPSAQHLRQGEVERCQTLSAGNAHLITICSFELTWTYLKICEHYDVYRGERVLTHRSLLGTTTWLKLQCKDGWSHEISECWKLICLATFPWNVLGNL